VYGLLSLGLVLVLVRLLTPGLVWKEKWLGRSCWAMNIGLGLMVGLSLLPIGLLQAYASIETGLWYARSAEFLHQPLFVNLRWLRLRGDTIFLVGVAAFAWFMAGLWFGWSYEAEPTQDEQIDA